MQISFFIFMNITKNRKEKIDGTNKWVDITYMYVAYYPKTPIVVSNQSLDKVLLPNVMICK